MDRWTRAKRNPAGSKALTVARLKKLKPGTRLFSPGNWTCRRDVKDAPHPSFPAIRERISGYEIVQQVKGVTTYREVGRGPARERCIQAFEHESPYENVASEPVCFSLDDRSGLMFEAEADALQWLLHDFDMVETADVRRRARDRTIENNYAKHVAAYRERIQKRLMEASA